MKYLEHHKHWPNIFQLAAKPMNISWITSLFSILCTSVTKEGLSQDSQS